MEDLGTIDNLHINISQGNYFGLPSLRFKLLESILSRKWKIRKKGDKKGDKQGLKNL